jgi:hypothetical protein
VVKNLACRLLNESLNYGLVSVLQRSNASLTLEQTKQLAKLMMDEQKKGRNVLLSGSTLVQAVTGKRFGDNYDLDIYCTHESLPALRGLLAKHYGLCCQSAFPQYGQNSNRSFNFNPGIHRVESYVRQSDATILDAATVARRFFQADMAQQAALQDDPDIPDEPIVDMTYHNWRNECIYRMQKNNRSRFPPGYPITASPKGNGPKCIDLIVCEGSPEETIQNFDLNICKCTFTGDKFHIPSPFDTFHLRTKSDQFTDFVIKYMKYFLQPAASNPFSFATNDQILSRLRSKKVTNNMMMHIMQSFLKTAQLEDCSLPLLEYENALLSVHTSWKITPRYFLQLHNKCIKRVNRLLKYIKRDINVPEVDDLLRKRFLLPKPEESDERVVKRRKIDQARAQLTQHINHGVDDFLSLILLKKPQTQCTADV